MTDPREITPVHKRCWCYRYGRCLTDCPTADLPFPRSSDGRIAGDAEWHDAYRAVIAVAYPHVFPSQVMP